MTTRLSRRQVLAAAAAAPVSVALAKAARSASDQRPVRLGVIGTGSRGTFLASTALTIPGVRIPAVCDVDAQAASRAQDVIEKACGKRPESYTDGTDAYRKLCTRADLDAVIIATPWQFHVPQALYAMKQGKYVGLEVPACRTTEEGWELIRVSTQTGSKCMMLENVCYFQNILAVQRMVSEGIFGDITSAVAGYNHDCRYLAFTDDGKLTWRGGHSARYNGNQYPTHPIGPVARWLGINHGDRFTRLRSVSTRSQSLRQYASRKLGASHPLARRRYAQGDSNTTILDTARGATVTLTFDIASPRPYDPIFRVQGTKGCYQANLDGIYIDDAESEHAYQNFSSSYQSKYEHPLWRDLASQGANVGGHGGGDYIVVRLFIDSVRQRSEPPISLVDAVTWSSIVGLTIESVAADGKTVEMPDFTQGKWRLSGR